MLDLATENQSTFGLWDTIPLVTHFITVYLFHNYG